LKRLSTAITEWINAIREDEQRRNHIAIMDAALIATRTGLSKEYIAKL
jgi:hypothetical protein